MRTTKQKFNVYGMTCAACSNRVETAVKRLNGVIFATVSLLTNEMMVEYGEGTTAAEIIKAVEKAGYNAVIAQKQNASKKAGLNKETRSYISRLVSSIALLLILMYLNMGGMIGLKQIDYLVSDEGLFVSALIQLFLSFSVLIINRKFFISGTKSLLSLSPNMDSLVALGSGVSFIYSLVITILIGVYFKSDVSAVHALYHGLYFEGAAMIVTLITLGKTLESLSKGKTTDAINALMTLAPDHATILVDGQERVVPIKDVSIGDEVVVKTGGYVPVDACITSGKGWLDQSSMTGESVPVEKAVGDEIYCGTVNVNGFFTARATKVGEDTTLGKIIELVKNVNLSKAPIAKIADKVSGIFVPAVILISLITLFIWSVSGAELSFAVQRAVSVLLISCPCALGLATPVAIMVGSGVAAKHGSLFKTATALENLGKTSAVVFDKTGTLTFGKPEVTDIISFTNDNEVLLKLAASLERLSEHPIASAIAARFDGEAYLIKDFKTYTGLGVGGIFEGNALLGGNIKLMKESGVDVSDSEAEYFKLSKQGKTVVYFAENGVARGMIAVSDKEKPSAALLIKSIKNMGITSYLLTGDNKTVALSVAERLGIDFKNVFAEVLPAEKANIICELKKTHKVAMVGDGVNDAPSLSAADVGVSLENGSFVATEAADVMILGDIINLVTAIKLSKKVVLNVKENLFWAFFYNVICIPLAAGAFYYSSGLTLDPMIAAGAMSLSSLFVVSNALRLNFFKPIKPLLTCDFNRNAQNGNYKKENIKMQTITLTVKGMMCAHCEARVKKAVECIDGVTECIPDHSKNTAVVYCEKPIDKNKLISAIESEGYQAE